MMPSEPDNKMEELLRTYARKRREDGGDPPELHPATRRLLQAEAARLRPREAAPRRPLWRWLLLHWPRVAFAVGLIALLAVTVWNVNPDRGQSSPPALFAKRDQEAEAASRPQALGRDGLAAPKAQPDGVAEQDKDLAKRRQPEAKPSGARALDEVRLDDSLHEVGQLADMKLTQESTGRGIRLQPAPARGPQSADALAASGPTENRLLVRRLDTGVTATRFATGQAASRLESSVTNARSSVESLALAPGAGSRGEQPGTTYSAPAAGTATDSYSLPPLAAKASPATNAVSFFNPLGSGVGAERPEPAWKRSTVPAATSPITPAVLAFDSRNIELKGGRAGLGVETRDGTASVLPGERSETRARATGAGNVLLATEAAPSPTLAKQYYRFQRLAEAEKAVAASGTKESAPVGVLATFDIELDGDQVRVIDSDGSVYSGRFVTVAEIGPARFSEIREDLNRPVPTGSEPIRRANTAGVSRSYYSIAGSSPATTNRVFRVNGTNRSYGQLVTIEAALSGGPEASIAGGSRGASPAGAVAPLSTRPASETYLKLPAKPPASAPAVTAEIRQTRRVVGWVRIGASNQVKLDAVPVAK